MSNKLTGKVSATIAISIGYVCYIFVTSILAKFPS